MSKNYKGLYIHIINALNGVMSKDYFIAEVLPIIEDAFIKAEKYDEAQTLRIEDVLTYEGTKGKFTEADYKFLYVNALKRIEGLEKENTELLKANSFNNNITNKISAEKHKLELNYKVLVEGVRELKLKVGIDKGNDAIGIKDFYFVEGENYKENFYVFLMGTTDFTKYRYNKIKAMLELVEELHQK